MVILDADKEGFLRSRSALIQTMGRAARNARGRVILYADTVTESMEVAIGVTQRRRAVQEAYNLEHGIDPSTVTKAVTDILGRLRSTKSTRGASARRAPMRVRTPDDLGIDDPEVIRTAAEVERLMLAAADALRFEEAALLRDELHALRSEALADGAGDETEDGALEDG